MLRFEGMRTFIPAPPLLHSNQTPVAVPPRLRAFRCEGACQRQCPTLRAGDRDRHRASLARLEDRGDKSHEKDDKENEKQNPRHTGSGGGYAAKAEHARDQRDNSKNNRPVKHVRLLGWM